MTNEPTIPEPRTPDAELCSHCGMEVEIGEIGVRYFGTHVAHAESRCLYLLRDQLDLLRSQYENLRRDKEQGDRQNALILADYNAAQQTIKTEREVSDGLAEALDSFMHWLAPLAEMAGSQWADDHSGEVNLNQATHWANECSKDARAALARHAALRNATTTSK